MFGRDPVGSLVEGNNASSSMDLKGHGSPIYDWLDNAPGLCSDSLIFSSAQEIGSELLGALDQSSELASLAASYDQSWATDSQRAPPNPTAQFHPYNQSQRAQFENTEARNFTQATSTPPYELTAAGPPSGLLRFHQSMGSDNSGRAGNHAELPQMSATSQQQHQQFPLYVMSNAAFLSASGSTPPPDGRTSGAQSPAAGSFRRNGLAESAHMLASGEDSSSKAAGQFARSNPAPGSPAGGGASDPDMYTRVPLGEKGRMELKAAIRGAIKDRPELRERVNAVAKLRCATIPQLLKIASICDLWHLALNISQRFLETRNGKQGSRGNRKSVSAFAAPPNSPLNVGPYKKGRTSPVYGGVAKPGAKGSTGRESPSASGMYSNRVDAMRTLYQNRQFLACSHMPGGPTGAEAVMIASSMYSNNPYGNYGLGESECSPRSSPRGAMPQMLMSSSSTATATDKDSSCSSPTPGLAPPCWDEHINPGTHSSHCFEQMIMGANSPTSFEDSLNDHTGDFLSSWNLS